MEDSLDRLCDLSLLFILIYIIEIIINLVYLSNSKTWLLCYSNSLMSLYIFSFGLVELVHEPGT